MQKRAVSKQLNDQSGQNNSFSEEGDNPVARSGRPNSESSFSRGSDTGTDYPTDPASPCSGTTHPHRQTPEARPSGYRPSPRRMYEAAQAQHEQQAAQHAKQAKHVKHSKAVGRYGKPRHPASRRFQQDFAAAAPGDSRASQQHFVHDPYQKHPFEQDHHKATAHARRHKRQSVYVAPPELGHSAEDRSLTAGVDDDIADLPSASSEGSSVSSTSSMRHQYALHTSKSAAARASHRPTPHNDDPSCADVCQHAHPHSRHAQHFSRHTRRQSQRAHTHSQATGSESQHAPSHIQHARQDRGQECVHDLQHMQPDSNLRGSVQHVAPLSREQQLGHVTTSHKGGRILAHHPKGSQHETSRCHPNQVQDASGESTPHQHNAQHARS